WRKMAATTGERTFIAALFPPGTAHIDGVASFGFPSAAQSTLIGVAAGTSTLAADFFMRSTAGANLREPEARRLPTIRTDHALFSAAALRTLRLNAFTTAYADLWSGAYDPSFTADAWAGGLDRP